MVEYLGMKALPPFVAYAVSRVDQVKREEYLQLWRTRVLNIHRESMVTRPIV